jgi:hypothetical protein
MIGFLRDMAHFAKVLAESSLALSHPKVTLGVYLARLSDKFSQPRGCGISLKPVAEKWLAQSVLKSKDKRVN